MTLPSGWTKSPIGDLCGLINGKAFKPSDWAKAGLPIIRIQNLNRTDADFNFCNTAVDERFIVEPGELLFAWSGTPGTSFGAHVWQGPRAVLNQHIFRVRFDEATIERDFFKGAINSTLEELIGKAHGGVGLAHVTKGKFEATEVLLPPKAEQRRIVAKLDALTARFIGARVELDRVKMLTASLREQAQASAYSGELTRDLRDGASIDWPCVPLLSIADVVTGSTPPTAEKDMLFGGETPFFKPTDLDAGYHVSIPRETLSRAGAGRARVVPAGSTLVTCIGATISKAGFARVPCAFNQQINAAIPKPGVADPRWLYRAITAPSFRSAIIENASATTMPIINKGRFQALTLPLPPLWEQVEIAERLETAFARADRFEAEVTRARALLDRLESAILAKAFRGELVPQDPNDEPASVLLERIRAQRAAALQPKRGRRAAGASTA